MSAGSATPRAAQMPSFHGRPGGTTGQALMPTAAGLTACQMSTYGWPVTRTYGEVTPATIRLSFEPGTRWSTSTPSRRSGPGPNPRTSCGSASMPSSGSTTAPDSNPTTAPHHPESASSTTRSASASTSGTTLRRRQLPASTSSPYIIRTLAVRLSPAVEPRRPGAATVETRARSPRTLACMSPAAGAATLATRRSSRFVAWVRAWRAGLVPYDELGEEIAGEEEHLVADAPGTL